MREPGNAIVAIVKHDEQHFKPPSAVFPRHILVAEDKEDIRDLLEQLLADTYRVTFAADGQEAITCIERERPDLLILDLLMPVLDGFAVLEYLAAHPGPFLPVIVRSAIPERDARLKALTMGAHEFLGSPCDPEELVVRIQTMLALKAAREAAERKVDELGATVFRKSHELQASQAILQSILDSAFSGIVALVAVRDEAGSITDFRVTLANPTSAQMFGFTAQQMLGRSYLQLSPDCVDSGLFAHFVSVTEKSIHIEVESQPLSERPEYWLNVSAVKIEDGVAVTLTDISERKRTQVSLARQKDLITRILDASPTGIAYMDANLDYELVNPAQAHFWGLPAEQAVGKSICEVLGSEAAAQLAPVLERVLAGEPYYATSVEGTHAADVESGRTSYWDLVYQPVRDEHHVVAGILTVATDVSDRVASEHVARDKIQALVQADLHKELFLGILSHELRTPLNAIQGFGSILEDGVAGDLNPDQARYVGKMLDGSEMMLGLVNDLLDMSRVQAGKFSLELQAVTMPALIHDVMTTLAAVARQKGHALVNKVPLDLPMITADATRVGQVMSNLVVNAIKYTPDGGTITVGAQVSGKMLLVEVSDTGLGVLPEQRERIFQAFTQVNMTTTREMGGVGLGLSIVKALVEAHGGEVGVESAGELQGSTFWFTLPLDSPLQSEGKREENLGPDTGLAL